MEHYYSEKQSSVFLPKKIKVFAREKNFEFYTASGVFSKDRLDKGSELLLNNCIIKENFKILDLGCGYGVIGIVLKKIFPKTEVVMSDINERTIALSRINAKLNNVEVEVIKSNIYDKITGKFDTIIVNPPQKAGKEICFAMIEKSKTYLKDKGLLQVVALHNKGGRTFEKKMKETFGNAREIAKKSGFMVYVSENKIKEK